MKRILIVVPLALTAALLTGCSLAGSSGDSALREPATVHDVAPGDIATGGSTELMAPGSDGKAMSVVGPQIITTVDVTVTVQKPVAAADDAARIAEKFGGSVSYRSERTATDGAPGSAQLTLRIPSAKLNSALDELKKLGVPQETSINALDVTAEATDLDARITSLQTSVDRLLTLMAQATSTENLLAVESALSERQANLESLQAQKRNLDDMVQLSTVNLNLISERDTPVQEPDTFWSGLVTGWNSFIGFLSGALVVLGVLIPWLAAAGLITAIVLVWVTLARRRSAAKKMTDA